MIYTVELYYLKEKVAEYRIDDVAEKLVSKETYNTDGYKNPSQYIDDYASAMTFLENLRLDMGRPHRKNYFENPLSAYIIWYELAETFGYDHDSFNWVRIKELTGLIGRDMTIYDFHPVLNPNHKTVYRGSGGVWFE